MWRCSACGTENSDNSQNCRHCQQPRPEPKPERPRSSGKWALLAGCAAALALVIGGVTFFTGREADKPQMAARSLGSEPSEDAAFINAGKSRCGEKAYWTLENGTLTISGSGAMEDYDYNYSPWLDHRDDIKKVIIEDGITSIGAYAFENCDSLTSVTIPDSVTEIGTGVFHECDSLTDLTIPDSVTEIGASAFAMCGSLTRVSLPDSLVSIGETAFNYCQQLSDISIPQNVVKIGQGAFVGCSSLTRIEIPGGVSAIEDWTFSECNNLKEIIIHDGVVVIGTEAICGCAISSLILPDSVKTMEDYSIHNCKNLVDLTIPESVTAINEYAFEDSDQIIIHTTEGSYAQSYAREHKIPYKLPGSDQIYAYDLTATVRTGDTTGYDRVKIADASASTELYSPDTKLTYYASNVLDGDLSTCWQEGGEGYGIGEYIDLYLENETELSALTFKLGNAYSPTAYDLNSRPSELMISFPDGSSVTCQFPDRMTEYMVELSDPVCCGSFRISIMGAYEGSAYQDTCITEIRAFSKAS